MKRRLSPARGRRSAEKESIMDAPATNEIVMMLCPSLKCRKVLRVPGHCRGKQVRCQFCQLTFEVPMPKRVEDKRGDEKA
jgi:hypothetical protein